VRCDSIVYLYVMDGLLNLYTGWLCRVLGLPVVQELCEWFPGDPTSSALTKWLYKKSMFKRATGILVISTAIEERVRQRAAEVNPHLLIHRVPAIVDARRFAVASAISDRSDPSVPYFLYCGTWPRDMYFVIRATALVKRHGFRCKLKLIGSPADQSDSLLACALQNGLSPEDIVVAAFVPHLAESYRGSIALMMPLPNDDRSLTRIPNKLGEYLASGRPVVTCEIGDLTNFLIDGVNAYLAEPGNERDFAEKMMAILRDPNRAAQIGAAGQQYCIAHLDYRTHISGLADFFVSCIDYHKECHVNRKHGAQMHRGYMVLRNCFCGLLAIGVIASGRVRRARRRALGGDVITAIYFHKPNRRLLVRCLRWLMKHGYTFISANELVEILHRGKTSPRGAVWLSFDDGFKELLDDVLPLIRQLKIPVTLFIPSGIIEGDGQFPWLHNKTSTRMYGGGIPTCNGIRDSMTVAELKRVASFPEVTIGSHTVNHTVTTNLKEEKARFELGTCKRTLESWTGYSVKCFAYPEGRFDGREQELLREFGYDLAATTENAFVTSETQFYQVPRCGVGDEISFPEAICNMVGVWRPAIQPVIKLLQRWSTIRGPSRWISGTPGAKKTQQSA